MKKTLPYLVIAGLILYLVLFSPKPLPPETIITIERDTIRDTVQTTSTVYVPKIRYVDRTDTLWKMQNVDTALILADYFTYRYYQDTVLNDSTAFLVVKDTLYKNKIKSRQTSLKVYPQTIKETITITQSEKLRTKWFYGLGVGGNPESFGIAPSFMLLTKKENAFTLSYDFINKDYWLAGYWKIKFRK